jgi:DNA end-binding protein Ku
LLRLAIELKLAETLIEVSTPKRFDLGHFKDDYSEKLRELIEKKAGGEEVVAPPAEEEPQVINHMDALKQSLAKTQGSAAEREKPARRTAPSVRKHAHRARKRKTG